MTNRNKIIRLLKQHVLIKDIAYFMKVTEDHVTDIQDWLYEVSDPPMPTIDGLGPADILERDTKKRIGDARWNEQKTNGNYNWWVPSY